MTANTESLLFEKFQVISCLKKDQNSSVYIAYHRYLDKRILLKTLDIDAKTDPVLLQRFKREAKILAQCDHPNIIKVLDFGTHGSFFYISFEYFPSKSLREFTREHDLSEHEKISIVFQVALALQSAHQKGIIHRDIKPENILVDENVLVKLADFGLAQLSDERALTQKTTVVGTPGYMSPEQILGEKLTGQSDLFSLGIVMQELFTGKNPFMGADVGKTLNNILTMPEEKYVADGAGMPPSVREIVGLLMQRNKGKRMASAGELIEQLERYYPNYTRITGPQPVGRKKARLPVYAWLIIFIAILAAAGSGYRFLLKNRFVAHPVERMTAEPQSPVLSPAGDNQPHAGSPEVKGDYAAVTGQIADVPVTQPQPPGKLYVKCLPWADVYVDSVRIDTTPLYNPVQLAPGVHEIVLKHPDYPPYRKRVVINSKQISEMAVNLDTAYAFLDPQVLPWGEIYIDDRMYGTTPFSKPLILQSGPHVIKVMNPQFTTVIRKVNLAKKDTTVFQLNFKTVAIGQNKNE
jgi:eukaryotic-like serine/threonine-protein kinase